ncbi:uncharacterized protein LOC114518023 isoform X2 [Dendronephthya gigantea]|uniref:uncharacterized protein LOC114518023 isoform X2 n=1 Tax=Dendronephthya gigantea TaxID=151771 RepID=UPI00106B2E63|nr:uncharacterized protein LOC114518023 isoform X2 [Dendronephthya gigantea]
MASSLFNYIILVVLMCELQNVFAGTRYQPSIIWERFNPILKCKCNWMTITKLDIYDRIELVCPNSILVSALRLEDVSKAHVFYDMYIRKFYISANNSLEELEKALHDDSFCDPTQSKKLYSCVRDDPRGAYKLRIHSDDDHREGDISVIFSNSDSGDQGDLSNTRKKCALVFIINVTSSSGEKYDMTYRKCLSQEPSCYYKNKTCLACRGEGSSNEKPSTTSKTTRSMTTSPSGPKTTESGVSTKQSAPTKSSVPTRRRVTTGPGGTENVIKKTNRNTTEEGNTSGRKSDTGCNFKAWHLGVGIVAAFAAGVGAKPMGDQIVNSYNKVNRERSTGLQDPEREAYANPVFHSTTPIFSSNDTPDGEPKGVELSNGLAAVKPSGEQHEEPKCLAAVKPSEKTPISEWNDNAP